MVLRIEENDSRHLKQKINKRMHGIVNDGCELNLPIPARPNLEAWESVVTSRSACRRARPSVMGPISSIWVSTTVCRSFCKSSGEFEVLIGRCPYNIEVTFAGCA